jgi:hypothetical protein
MFTVRDDKARMPQVVFARPASMRGIVNEFLTVAFQRNICDLRRTTRYAGMTAANGRRTRQDADSAIQPRTRLTRQSGKPRNALSRACFCALAGRALQVRFGYGPYRHRPLRGVFAL